MVDFRDPSTRLLVLSLTRRVLQRRPQVDLREPAVKSASKQVWTELRFPVPPVRLAFHALSSSITAVGLTLGLWQTAARPLDGLRRSGRGFANPTVALRHQRFQRIESPVETLKLPPVGLGQKARFESR